MRIGLVLLLVTAPVAFAGKQPVNRLALIQASCFDAAAVRPIPCSPSFRFASGSATLVGGKEPGPTCPKSNGQDRTEAKAGDVRLTGVTKDGAPFSGTLTAGVWYKTTFGADPNGDCPLANIQVPNFASLDATLACKNGKCRGTLHPVQCLPKECADVPVLSELGSVIVNGQAFGPLVVLDEAGNPLATPGTAVAAGKEP
jgi:hypothetical protein